MTGRHKRISVGGGATADIDLEDHVVSKSAVTEVKTEVNAEGEVISDSSQGGEGAEQGDAKSKSSSDANASDANASDENASDEKEKEHTVESDSDPDVVPEDESEKKSAPPPVSFMEAFNKIEHL